MTRPIKFRAWDGSTYHYLPSVWNDTCNFDGDGDVDPTLWPLEQSTGLHDKNGKEIYEGDIVRTTFGVATIEWREEVVGFQSVAKDGSTAPMSSCAYEFEVIGNIHENPDLLP